MKYQPGPGPTNIEQRKAINEKVLYLIDSGSCGSFGITKEDIYNAYTGTGGLHGLKRGDFKNYYSYSLSKKEFENGQFFTPPSLCEMVMDSLKMTEYHLVADLTFGKGSFFNYAPVESNLYSCELDASACKVARYLFPRADLVAGDIWTYQPEVRFDFVVGNGRGVKGQTRKSADFTRVSGLRSLFLLPVAA